MAQTPVVTGSRRVVTPFTACSKTSTRRQVCV